MPDIGLLNEKPLHASLKRWYAQPGDRFEVAVDGFVIDIVRDDLLVEIQSGGFASVKEKLVTLVAVHRLRLVYPIAREKWIVRPAPAGGDEPTRRRSPKRGQMEDLFWEMVSFPRLLAHPNFSLEVLMIREEEVRRYAGTRSRRRRKWAVEERRLVGVDERRVFERPADWQVLVPLGLGEPFTTRDLADAAGMSRPLAQKMAYCLCQVGVVELLGRQGRSNVYGLAGA